MSTPETPTPSNSSEIAGLENRNDTAPEPFDHVKFTVMPENADDTNGTKGEKSTENNPADVDDEDDDRAFLRVVYVGGALGIIALICFGLSAFLPQSINRFIWGVLVILAFSLGFVLLPLFRRYTPSGFTGLKISMLVMFLIGAVACTLATIFTTSGGFLKYFIFPVTAILFILYSIALCLSFKKKEDGD